ncbi:MAG: glycosyltransferase family 2 protein [Phycisphaerae bacterium]
MTVAICVITFQRPEGLRRLLRGLDALNFRADPPEVEIVVVDNDPNGSAGQVCDEYRSELKWPLRYHVEPRRGIPFARNRALACVADHADFVAFIDDDEVPEPCWLDELLRVQHSYDADVVAGPVVPYFPEEVPSWVVKGRFFERPRHPTGYRLDVAYTGNVLARRAVFQGMESLFDERMALTGGSDSHFFHRVHRAGYTIVWADEALAYEWTPLNRARFGWLVQRFFRIGNSRGLVAIDLGSSWSTRLVLAAKAAVWMVIGVLLVPCAPVFGRHVFVRSVRYMAYGTGLLLSIVGSRYEEYKQTR